MLIDSYGRSITYLRISVTDRCNFRCLYCVPEAGVQWQEQSDLLTADEIARITEAAAAGGVQSVRLTGGEPLVRPDIVEIVGKIASIPGIIDVSLTTNAMLLDKLARPLADAGLTRVNISLDTLDPEKFRRITRGGRLDRLWHGINAAEQAGLGPIKLNTVVVNGLNSNELPDLARLTLEHSWHVRFIELMPLGNSQTWGKDYPESDQRYLSVQQMHLLLSDLELQPTSAPTSNGPARTFRCSGAMGTIGFISPVGDHFCTSCNRLRLTADGFLRPCLLLDREVDIRDALKAGAPLLPLIEQAVQQKPKGHELSTNHFPELRRMAQIGG